MFLRTVVALGVVLSVWSAPAGAVNKCTLGNGAVVYQDTPCAGGKEESLDLRPSSEWGSGPVVRPAAPAETPVAAEPPPAGEPAVRVKSPLEADADQCLAWYLRLLPDPLRTYYTNPRKDRRVLSIDIHTPHPQGGIFVKTASCEIDAGLLNESWTKTHAKRGGWIPD